MIFLRRKAKAQNFILASFLIWLGLHGFEEERREPIARGREGRGEEDQGMESLFLGFDMNPKVFGWRLVSPLVRVVWKHHINL